jgi:hypothetical protein
MRLADAYQSLRIESKEKWLAVRTYRREIRDDRRNDKRNKAAGLQAHALSKSSLVLFTGLAAISPGGV